MKARIQRAAVILMIGFSSYASALSPIGPAQALLGEDQWGVGMNVGYQSMDLVADGTFYEYPPSPAGTRETPDKIALKDVESISSFVQIGLGLSPEWDIYGCIGASEAQGDATVKSASSAAGQAFGDGEQFDLNGSHSLAWGFGTRFTLKDCDTVKWGGMAQMTWQKPKGNSAWTAKNDPGYRVDGTWEMDYWELIVAVGPTFVYDNVQFYGGPFLHMVRGDLDFAGSTTDTSRASTSQNLKEEALVGAYAGMQFDLCRRQLFYVDGQFTGNAWGIGLGAILRME
ncbi:MAG: hypothetical protein K9N55_18525 [Phycisphaerae bacterium]|nr:hypothetical protein [Phycisphaerae bacterium]